MKQALSWWEICGAAVKTSLGGSVGDSCVEQVVAGAMHGTGMVNEGLIQAARESVTDMVANATGFATLGVVGGIGTGTILHQGGRVAGKYAAFMLPRGWVAATRIVLVHKARVVTLARRPPVQHWEEW